MIAGWNRKLRQRIICFSSFILTEGEEGDVLGLSPPILKQGGFGLAAPSPLFLCHTAVSNVEAIQANKVVCVACRITSILPFSPLADNLTSIAFF